MTVDLRRATYRDWMDAPPQAIAAANRFWFGPPFPPADYSDRMVWAAVYVGRAVGCWGARVEYPFAWEVR